MSKASLLTELYKLVEDMTTDEGYSYNWGSVKSWDNGAFICKETPQLHIRLLQEVNDDIVNGVGNNFQQLQIPMQIRFGMLLDNPDPVNALENSEFQLEQLEYTLVEDISRMYASPFKIRRSEVPEYCGTEYTGEGTLTEDEEGMLDGYTVIGVMEFTITYKRNRRING